jgi:hypothetical protein
VATIGFVIDGENKEYLQNFSGESSCKRPLGRPRSRLEDSINMALREVGVRMKGESNYSSIVTVGGFGIGGVEFPSDDSADDRPCGGDDDDNNFSIQFNSLLFMCRVNSHKANYRHKTV